MTTQETMKLMTRPVLTIKGCYYPHLTYGKKINKFLNKKLEKETRAGKMAQGAKALNLFYPWDPHDRRSLSSCLHSGTYTPPSKHVDTQNKCN